MNYNAVFGMARKSFLCSLLVVAACLRNGAKYLCQHPHQLQHATLGLRLQRRSGKTWNNVA
jgi:hypothetical protein